MWPRASARPRWRRRSPSPGRTCARPAAVERLGAVRVGADELGLPVPQPGEVERDLGRHAHHHDAAPGPCHGQGITHGGLAADGVDGGVGAGGQVVAHDVAADDSADGPGQLGGRHDVVGAEPAGGALLVRVPGADDDAGVRHVAHETGDRGEAHRAGAEHGDDRFGGVGDGGRAAGHQGGVDAAGERLDEHGALVGHVIGRAGGVGCRGRSAPAPSRRPSSSRSRSGSRVRGRRRRGGRSRRRHRARRPRTGGGSRGPRGRGPARARPACRRRASPTTSWPGTNGKLTQSSKYVEAWPSTIDRSDPQIPASRVLDTVPAGTRQLGRIDVGVLQRPHPHRRRRRQRRRHPGQPQPPDRPPHLQRLHPSVSCHRSACCGGLAHPPSTPSTRMDGPS